MRISVRRDDLGFSDYAFGAKVFVDGVQIDKCFTADEELGLAYCYDVNNNGDMYEDPDNKGQAREIILRGKVEIKI
jgi:hypothetical protein